MMNPYVSLVLLLLVAGAVLLLAVVHLMARALTRPPRMTDGKALSVLHRLTPKDVGLRFEPTTFEVRDIIAGGKLKLAAWWMPADKPSEKTVILVHGYADAKVGALAWAPAWHEVGFNILGIDLRAHGDSEGTLCTGGFAERHDLEQVVHQIIARKPQETQTLALFGASLGAAAVAGAAALLAPAGEPASASPILAGVVLESPFADFRSASTSHFQQLGLPVGRIAKMALRHAERLTSARFADVRPVDLIGRIGCPLLVLAADDDAYLNGEEFAAIAHAVAARPAASGVSVYRRFEGIEHLMAVVVEPSAYRETLKRFLDQVQGLSRQHESQSVSATR